MNLTDVFPFLKKGWSGLKNMAAIRATAQNAYFHGYSGPTWSELYGSNVLQNKLDTKHANLSTQNVPNATQVYIPYIRIPD